MMQKIMENFELLLTLAVLICFIFYLIDSKGYLKERRYLLKTFKGGAETDADRNRYAMRLTQAMQNGGISRKLRPAYDAAQAHINNRQPLSGQELHWAAHPVYPKEKFIEFFSGMFWILFIIWLVRSFLWEPFQIPSASMEPTLQNGDFILTSKYSYGLRLPVTHHKILPIGDVKRGDVVVFRYPPNPKINYIKRIVAVGGDKIVFSNGQIAVNGELVPLADADISRFGHDNGQRYIVANETLNGKSHQIQFNQNPMFRMNAARQAHSSQPFMFQDSSEITVPEGHYFAMGDNRDDSVDSRFWGFVPEANIVGKALFIWLNSDCIMGKGHCNRIGKSIP